MIYFIEIGAEDIFYGMRGKRALVGIGAAYVQCYFWNHYINIDMT